jgi:hypothetical protein
MRDTIKHLPILLAGALALGACNKGAPAIVSAVGVLAPEVSIPDESGKPVSVSSFRGKQAVLLAFYPKDFSSG